MSSMKFRPAFRLGEPNLGPNLHTIPILVGVYKYIYILYVYILCMYVYIYMCIYIYIHTSLYLISEIDPHLSLLPSFIAQPSQAPGRTLLEELLQLPGLATGFNNKNGGLLYTHHEIGDI